MTARKAKPTADQGLPLVDNPIITEEHTIEAEPRIDVEMPVEELREKAREINPATASYLDDIILESDKMNPVDGATENERKIAEVFSDLSPSQKEVVMRKYRVHVSRRVTTEDPMFIDQVYAKKAAPQWFFYWMAPRGINKWGMRGYRPVVRTPKMSKVVPNCRQIGTSKYIMHSNNVLCALPMTEHIHRQSRQWRDANEVVSAMGPHHHSAWRAVASKIGLPKSEAEKMDREGKGLFITRGHPDPESPEKPDYVTAEDESEEELVIE